jgi:hypothetical protein
MKRAFIVCGAEASGTKLTTKILLASGCEGDATNEQWVERALKNKYTFECDPVVLRQSFPCGLEAPDLKRYIWHFHCIGYAPQVIVTVRDWWANQQAQLYKQTHALNPEHSLNKMQEAYLSIFYELHHFRIPFLIVTYESIIARPELTVRNIISWCNLPQPEMSKLPEIYDANEKWYSGNFEPNGNQTSD